jgi:hypothetical protein
MLTPNLRKSVHFNVRLMIQVHKGRLKKLLGPTFLKGKKNSKTNFYIDLAILIIKLI